MRAARAHSPAPIEGSPLHLGGVPSPEPGVGELLLDVVACAVCRTDLQLAEGDISPRFVPFVLGHQAVGRIAGAGEGVSGFAIGDRVGALADLKAGNVSGAAVREIG